MKINKHHGLLAGLAALTLTGLTIAGSSTQRVKWTSLGNCGFPRAGYEDDITRGTRYMTMPSSSGFTNFYFPVNVDTQTYGPDYVSLRASIIKAASDENVTVYLKEYRMDTGLVYTRLSMNSYGKGTSSSKQIISDVEFAPGWSFEDPDAVFFLDVRMYNQSSSGGAPRLYGLSLTGDFS